jgi:hypothetical protein
MLFVCNSFKCSIYTTYLTSTEFVLPEVLLEKLIVTQLVNKLDDDDDDDDDRKQPIISDWTKIRSYDHYATDQQADPSSKLHFFCYKLPLLKYNIKNIRFVTGSFVVGK